jgi:hypothetical protein
MFNDRPSDFFGLVVNSGNDSQFILPLRYGSGTAHHDLTIDWGDGEVQKVTGVVVTAQYQGLTHAYPVPNINYTIKITGSTYLMSAEHHSLFGLGFNGVAYGYNADANKRKLKGLLGNIDALMSSNIPSKWFCYANMFNGCTGLTELPATLLPSFELESFCYYSMFHGCTGLTKIPATLLPATKLARDCYFTMFHGCTGLTELPEGLLPATVLRSFCYAGMFCDCSGLTEVPETLLPAFALADNCYASMFGGCVGLTALPATLLPALRTGNACYQGMFYNCTGLTEIPATLLPANSLDSYCYYQMFSNCGNLNHVYMDADWFNTTPVQPKMFRNCYNIASNTSYINIPSEWK